MSKGLILVESPTKARTLFKFLKGDYQIEASMGHVRDLPKGDFGVDVENNFAPKYVIPADKRKTVEFLKDKVKGVSRIILATDPDREGEAIAHHLYELLKQETRNSAIFDRIVFHEITEPAVHAALVHPRAIDLNLVSAQTARRVLDRIVGYRLSPLLWKKVKRRLSAGRVQSVALRLIVEREREIERFKAEEFYRVFVTCRDTDGEKTWQFELIRVDGKDIESEHVIDLYDGKYTYKKTTFTAKTAEEVEQELKGIASFVVLDVSKKETRRAPPPPFITSTLQQEAARRFGFAGKKTMSIAQRLYEEGYITYHRTDSFQLASQFISSARGFIKKKYGEKYLSSIPRVYRTKSKVAQEAHEAIRPTKLDENSKFDPAKGSTKLGKDYARLYELIWKRAVATQMAEAVFESTKIHIEGKNTHQYLLECAGSVVTFEGFLALGMADEKNNLLAQCQVGERLMLVDTKVSQHTTSSPARYSEASLVASLEKNGIGRPSTYAPIISTIQVRHYVERQEGRFVATPIGVAVNDFLVKNFSTIDDIPFTAHMEDELDDIANGKKEWTPMIQEFYGPFEKKMNDAEKEDKVEIQLEKTGKMCPTCGSLPIGKAGEVIIRFGKFGKFYSCSRFPDCTYTAPLIQDTGKVCPRDQGKIVVRRTRKGRIFYGCGNYPKCKFAVWKLGDLDKSSPKM